MLISYGRGLAGSRKSSHAKISAHKLAYNEKKKIIFKCPSKLLIEQTIDDLRKIIKISGQKIKLTSLHSDNTDQVVNAIIKHFELAVRFDGEILLITQDAFSRIPNMHRDMWQVIGDEIDEIYTYIKLEIGETYKTITDHIIIEPSSHSSDFIILRSNNKAALLELYKNRKDDMNWRNFKVLAQHLVDGYHTVFVRREFYDQLLNNPNFKGEMHFFSITTDEIFANYEKVFIFGAFADKTLMFKLWPKMFATEFLIDSDFESKLLFQKHENGHRLRLYYLFDEWTRTHKNLIINTDTETNKKTRVIHKVKELIDKFFENGEDFAYLSNNMDGYMFNKDIALNMRYRLPNNSHGLNSFKQINRIALISSIMPAKPEIAFFDSFDISVDEVIEFRCFIPLYQAMMRGSIRDPDATCFFDVVCMGANFARWIAPWMIGCSVQKLPHSIPNLTKKTAGRSKQYNSTAERVRAYRARKRQQNVSM